MGNALNKLWAFFTVLFTALERTAKIADNIAQVGEMSSQDFITDAEHKRKLAKIERDKELALPAPTT